LAPRNSETLRGIIFVDQTFRPIRQGALNAKLDVDAYEASHQQRQSDPRRQAAHGCPSTYLRATQCMTVVKRGRSLMTSAEN
jgi:hypothetical protein